MSSGFMPATTAGVTGPNVPPVAPRPQLPVIPQSRTVVNPASPGAGRDAGVVRRNDPAEISGRISQIFSNLGAALGTESESEADRLARLTREVQAGRSFDDLRRSAGLIAQAQPQAPRAPEAVTVPEYPTTPLPLSPEVQRALMQRRYEADEMVARAQADRDFRGSQALTQAGLSLMDVDRWQQQQDMENQRRLAARGVARSPLFANPAQRQVFETANRAGTEVRMNLANTLSELDRALRDAETRRAAELSQIELDTGTAQSDINRLLGVQ